MAVVGYTSIGYATTKKLSKPGPKQPIDPRKTLLVTGQDHMERFMAKIYDGAVGKRMDRDYDPSKDMLPSKLYSDPFDMPKGKSVKVRQDSIDRTLEKKPYKQEYKPQKDNPLTKIKNRYGISLTYEQPKAAANDNHNSRSQDYLTSVFSLDHKKVKKKQSRTIDDLAA